MKSYQDNDGRGLESTIRTIAQHYTSRGILKLEKVTPPVRYVKIGHHTQVVSLENPFPDFIGTWTERGGRMLAIEAKSNGSPRLPLGDSGLREKQRLRLAEWHNAGAACGVIWEYLGHGHRFLSVPQILGAWDAGKKSIKWDEAEPIPQGMGFIFVDFVVNLRKHYPKT